MIETSKKQNKSLMHVVSLIGSSIISIVLNLIIGFIIPKYISYSDYSSYKIFTFYIGFIPILHLGIIDGVLLKYSKFSIDEILKVNFKKLINQLYVFQLLFSIVFLLVSITMLNMSFQYIAVILAIPFVNIFGLYSKLLIIYNKFKIIALVNIVQKIITVIAIGVMYILGISNYSLLVIAFFVAYIIQIGVSRIACKELFENSKTEDIRLLDSIKVGFPIIISYFISTLILGLDRMFIERMSIEYDYAMYSFAYSMITIVLTIFNSINSISFSYIMRIGSERRDRIYNIFGNTINFLMITLSLGLVLIIPLVKFIIPNYFDSIQYFYFLYPIVFLRIDYSLRLWPYMNALNMGRQILLINIGILIISFILNYCVLYFKLPIIYYALMTVVSLLFWNYILDWNIKKVSSINKDNSNILRVVFISVILITYFNLDLKYYMFLIVTSILLNIKYLKYDLRKIIDIYKVVR